MDVTSTLAATILVVEDDPSLRFLAAEALQHSGFSVLEAENADAALVHLRSHQEPILATVSDVLMPGSMDGIELADWVHSHYPSMGILLMSGWCNWVGYDRRHEILRKPFRLADLVSKVQALALAAEASGRQCQASQVELQRKHRATLGKSRALQSDSVGKMRFADFVLPNVLTV
jgi:DNA-binding NtrC family response regulator